MRRVYALLVLISWLIAPAPADAQIMSGDIKSVMTPDATWTYPRFTGRCVGPLGEVYVQASGTATINVYASVSAWQMGSAPTRSFTFTGLTGGSMGPGGHQIIYANGSLYSSPGSGGMPMIRCDAATGVPLPTSLVAGSTSFGWGGIPNTGLACDGIYIYVFKGSNLEIRDLNETLLRTVVMPYGLTTTTTVFAAAGYFYPVRYSSPCSILERVRASDGAILPWSDALAGSLGCTYLTNAAYDYFFNRLLHTNGNPGTCQDTTFLYNDLVIGGGMVRTVSTTPTQVGAGQTGIVVAFDAENIAMNPISITGADLVFRDAGLVDRSSEYVVTPDPGNPTMLAAGTSGNFMFSVDILPSATLGTITIDGTLDSTDQVTMAAYQDLSADTTDSWDVLGAVPVIHTVDAVPTRIGPASSGHMVTVDIENAGFNDLDVNSVTLTFADAALVDVSSEYTVTPSPGNPTMIAAGMTETFDFSVALVAAATTGIITLDAMIDATDQTTGGAVADGDADTPDSWEVAGAQPFVRLVNALPPVVSPGGSGYRVEVSVENTGLDPILALGVLLTFTGTADRTGEYTVTPLPGNPTGIAAGATSVFAYGVAVAAGATFELITLDASFTGVDVTTGANVFDLGSDVTDSWTLVTCAATLCGDCTGDGVISILDALAAARHSAGLITLVGTDFTNCNVIGAIQPAPTAAVDILDALTIAQNSAGLPVTLVCC